MYQVDVILERGSIRFSFNDVEGEVAASGTIQRL